MVRQLERKGDREAGKRVYGWGQLTGRVELVQASGCGLYEHEVHSKSPSSSGNI